MQEAEAVPIATETPSLDGPPTPAVPSEADYPESDGRPMAETPWHWRVMVDATDPLREFFAGRPDVYVGSNMMMYYVENDNHTSVSADVFVTFGVPKLPERRVWRTWEEGGKFADFVLEVTSRSTRRKDETGKRDLYAELGVREYWQFDPDGDYLDPLLKGRRLDANGRYRPLVLEERYGALCHESLLGLELRLEGDRLRFYDPARREYLLTHEEERVARVHAASERRNAEAALKAAEAVLKAVEADNAELRRQLRSRGD